MLYALAPNRKFTLMTKTFEFRRLAIDRYAKRRIVADELTGDFMIALNRMRKPLDSTF